jgi:hypothetical protein
VSVPHNAAQQYRLGMPVDRDRLAPGDLVFFDRLRHNGIYLGDGRFVHATTPGGVQIARLDNEWFRTRWVGARRLWPRTLDDLDQTRPSSSNCSVMRLGRQHTAQSSVNVW